MTFDEILVQVLELLKRQGRVSYSALKRRFDLNDDYLNDLKDELLFAHPVVDEDNRGLVWTSETASGQAVAAPSAQPTPQPAAQDQRSPEITPRVTAPPSHDAERRQLTVMFCDLVDSTKLSSRLDPEEYREVVRAYQRVCTEVIQRYDGHIAQLLGDGLLVYFGYPQAHEDDPQRAVRTGLGILAAMGDLNSRLQPAQGIQLAIRIGIHTGLVVIGDMGGAGRQEQLALGEVPNVAARMQGLAEPNTVAISAAAYRLVQGFFECQELGEQALRGVSQPIAVYRVLQDSGARGRLDVAAPRGLTPLVGREQEVGLLLERWAEVKDGRGHVVLLTGDAGIGKSRLVQMLKDHVADEPHIRWECRSAEYSQNTALFPLTDLFQRLLRFQAEETPDEKLGKLEQTLSQYRLPLQESVPLFAPLLSLSLPEHHYPPLNLSPQRQRQKTLETIVAILLELAERQPVLFIVEDLHWTDPTTLELLNLILDQTSTASMLVLLTCRPTFQPSWSHRSYLTEITVNRLSQPQIERMIERITDEKRLPPDVRQLLVQRTDGVPLFVEEMTKAILESGHLKEVAGHYELTKPFSMFAIPATLQDSLMARLDRLVSAKGIAQLGAVIGRQFAYALLHAVSHVDDATLQRELSRLVDAELVYQRGVPPQSTYLFKHALIRDAAYESLLKSTRQQYHQRIAQVLEAQFPETAETQPELVAHHYTEAGLTEQAVGYWQQAGEKARQRSANTEAIVHLSRGLELIKMLPETPERIQQELVLLTELGAALMMHKGFAAPEVERTYAHALELCQHVGETPQIFPILAGLRRFYTVRAAFQTARELGERLLALAQRVDNPVFLLEAHSALGINAFWYGDFVLARAYFEQGLALGMPHFHNDRMPLYAQDPREAGLAHAALTAWLLGYPDQALRQSQEALTLAQSLAHLNTLVHALCWASIVHQHRREVQATQEQAEAVLTLSDKQGFQLWLALGTCQWGWALAEQGQRAAGMAQIRQGLAALRVTGQETWVPYMLALLAERQGQSGAPEAGLTVLDEALTLVDKNDERWCEAELHRLKGELLLAQSSGNTAEAQTCFHQAMNIAKRQQAKSWELRATTSLARLWQQQGKHQEAYNLLAPVYGWFTEGFDTADLKDAKALLDEVT
jgi:class 3 adenylate cyclase/predicted ATPase